MWRNFPKIRGTFQGVGATKEKTGFGDQLFGFKVSKKMGTFLGIPIIRIILFCCLHSGPSFYGSCQLEKLLRMGGSNAFMRRLVRIVVEEKNFRSESLWWPVGLRVRIES